MRCINSPIYFFYLFLSLINHSLYFSLAVSSAIDPGADCPSSCACQFHSFDFSIQNITCASGGLKDRDLVHILNDLPETVSSISIIGPGDSPNQLSISEDFARFYYLEHVRLVNSGIGSLGKGIFAENKFLRTLDVSFNRITHLSPDTFEGMENIQALDLSHNDLWMDYLATGTFVYLKNLRSLNLSDNKVAYFPSNLFGQLPRLHELILDLNYPDPRDLHILDQLPQLEHLSLVGCNLSHLPGEIFFKHRRLKRLNLSQNHLRSVEIPSLKYALQLESLDLSYNEIKEVPHYFLSMFPNLRSISLAGNYLGTADQTDQFLNRYPSDQFFSHLFIGTNCTHVDLSENRFQFFSPNWLSDSQSTVRSLKLSGNRFREIDLERITTNLSSLNELHLNGIGLSKLPDPLPHEFFQLQILNLSNNPLHPSIYDILPKLVDLKVLDISNCDLSAPPPGHFIDFLSKLSTFYVHRNPWHCSCDLAPFRDFLIGPRRPSSCQELKLAQIQCSTPSSVRGKPITLIKLYGGCDGELNDTDTDFLTSDQLIINTEVSILIGGICIAVFIVVAFIVGIACTQLRPQASYRTNEDKVTLSANQVNGGTVNGDQEDVTPSGAPTGGLERLF